MALSSTTGAVAPTRVLLASNFIVSPILEGIYVTTPDPAASPALDLTLTSNHVDVTDIALGTRSVTVEATQPATVCAAVTSNIFHHPPPDLGAGLQMTQAGGSAVVLEQGAAGATDPAATVLQVNNPGTNEFIVVGTLGIVGNGTCLLPGAP